MLLNDFYKGKRVFLTGHTGFKGSWMSLLLHHLGAQVCGYALSPPTEPNLFTLADVGNIMQSVQGDVRDASFLKGTMMAFSPDIAIHLAAQPLVSEGYRDPLFTFSSNVMGTVNFLEATRGCKQLCSVVVVTTDKVYQNQEWHRGYNETDALGGQDPYAASKACAELVTNSYRASFFADRSLPVSTVRAGNVIGGGDFSENRIVPDCIRAALEGSPIFLRNPYSIRPYQHVLDPLYAYLLLAMEQSNHPQWQGSYNVGPDESSCVTTEVLAKLFCTLWGEGAHIELSALPAQFAEAGILKLECDKLKSTINWKPSWDLHRAVLETVNWAKTYKNCVLSEPAALRKTTIQQIQMFLEAVQ